MTARLHYRLDGPEGAPVLVLGPSLGTTLDIWAPQLPFLTPGLRVLRYDLRGHGGSPVVPEQPAPAMADLAGDVLALLADLGIDRFAVGGVSLGGAIASTVAVTVPDRVWSLLLCCTSARFGDPGTWRERIALVRAEGMGGPADSAPERWFTAAFAARHPEVVGPVQEMLRTTDPEGYVACCEALSGFDQRDRLSEVTAPTLVLCGADDPVSPPEHGRELAEGIAGASLVVIDGASHLAGVERPEQVGLAMADHLKIT